MLNEHWVSQLSPWHFYLSFLHCLGRMGVCLPGTAKLSAGFGRALSLKKVQIGSVGFARREGIPEQWVLYHTQEEIQEVNAIDQ